MTRAALILVLLTLSSSGPALAQSSSASAMPSAAVGPPALGSLIQSRLEQNAVVLGDGGSILVAGGENGPTGNPSTVAAAELLAVGSTTWQSDGQLSQARDPDYMVETGGKVYAIGGCNQANTLSSAVVDIYTESSKTWTTGTSLPQGACGGSGWLVGGTIYYFEGLAAAPSQGTPHNYEYSISQNQWTQLADGGPQSVYSGAMQWGSGTNDILLIGGGSAAWSSATYDYSIAGNSFSSGPTLPVAIGSMFQSSCGKLKSGSTLCVGSASLTTTAYLVLNPIAKTATQVTSGATLTPGAVLAFGMSVVPLQSGRALIFGWDTADVLLYDPNGPPGGYLTKAASLNQLRGEAAMGNTTLGSYGYACGGYAVWAQGGLTSCEAYSEVSNTWAHL